MPEAFERIGYGGFSVDLSGILPMSRYQPKHAARKDGNHKEICDRFLQWNCSLSDSSGIGIEGFPDLVVGLGFVTLLVEIKDGAKGKLSPGQVDFHAGWRGSPVEIVRSVEDVDKLVERIRRAAYAQARKGVET